MRYVVEISEIRVAMAPDIIVCIGLGSCIAVVLYDQEKKIGGMSHALLPTCNGFLTDHKKFVDMSIQELLDLMESSGANRKNIIAKLVGGASIFQGLSNAPSIGEKNVLSGRQVLSKLGIRIVGEDVGGNKGRSVEFHTSTGDVIVKVGHRVKCII